MSEQGRGGLAGHRRGFQSQDTLVEEDAQVVRPRAGEASGKTVLFGAGAGPTRLCWIERLDDQRGISAVAPSSGERLTSLEIRR